MTKYTKLVTTATVPTCEAVSTARPVTSTKWVSRGKPGETEAERAERLSKQGAANHVKARPQADGSVKVSSQQKPAHGARAQHIVSLVNGRWTCDCEWSQHNPTRPCVHIIRAEERTARDARKNAESAAVTEQMITTANAAARATRGEWSEEV